MFTCTKKRNGVGKLFKTSLDTPICLDLISWSTESFTFIDRNVQKASKDLAEGSSVGEGSYWRAVFLLFLLSLGWTLCCGFILLKIHPLLSLFRYIAKLERWKHELGSLITSGAFDSNRNILFLAQLLNGDQKNLERAASVVVTEWWHLMPFYTFVKDPTVAYNELGPLALECRELFKNTENFEDGEFDPFLSILSMKDISVLQNLISNPWLSVHLIDTLLHTDSEYAVFVFSLWEVGADYLLHCGSEGRLRLESHIEAMYIQDDEMAENLMRICVEQELDDSKACIVNTMTYRYLRDGEWSAALSWALRGGRGPALDATVNRIVWHADKSEIASLSILDHMADYVAELGSPSLAFLFNYCRFHKSLSAGDVRSDAPVSFESFLFIGCHSWFRNNEFAKIFSEFKAVSPSRYERTDSSLNFRISNVNDSKRK
ncbi:unnamed protein product [Haemonchus placei]|uniref:Nuclear pore complex protein Nup85 n=1 Tax=Haemonchus placei TaxID=6290 RepID=A0A0N4WUZ2_HAEPC|nr:unnamed protein product [Haemonchus placei]